MKGTTMKKSLLFVALTFLSASAFASKARVAALGGSMTKADDVQDAFMNPAKIFGFGDLLTIEYAAADEEGGVFRSNGDTKYGVYFGHRSAGFASLVSNVNTAIPAATLLGEQNPFEIFYGQKGGDMRWAASFIYSNGEDKLANKKANTMGFRVGAATDVWEAYASVGLAGESKNTTTGVDVTAKNDLGLTVGGQYASGDVLYYGAYDSRSGKGSQGTAPETKFTRSQITVGAESKMKGDASHFFYGVRYNMVNTKAGDAKDDASNLPVYAGVEADAATWLVLRGSVSQSVLVNSNKADNGTGTTTKDNTGLTDTAANLGAGFKFGKLWIDTALTAGTNGNLDSSNIGTQASLNYTW